MIRNTSSIRQPRFHQKTLFGRCYSVAIWTLLLCSLGGAGWFGVQYFVQTQLASQIQKKANELLSGTGLTATVGQASFLEGEGIRINQLSLSLDQPSPTKQPTGVFATARRPVNQSPNFVGQISGPVSELEIYELFVHTSASLTELATQQMKIRAIELRRPKLTVVRNQQGDWDFQEVISKLQALQLPNREPTPIQFSDGEIRIVNERSSRDVVLNNVHLTILPIVHEGRPLLQINGSLSSRAISQVSFTSYIDPTAKRWQTDLRAQQARISADLLALLPPELQTEFDDLQTLTGRLNFQARATGDLPLSDVPQISLSGNIAGLTVDDRRLPLTISNAACNFRVGNNGFEVSDIQANLGQGKFAGKYWQNGLLERQSWHCSGKVEDFNFEHNPRFTKWLPQYCKKFCDEYSPAGRSNISFDLNHDGQQLRRTIHGDITDMAFEYVKMPYKVINCVGTVDLVDDKCDFNVQSLAGKQIIKLYGSAKGIGKDPTYQVNISVPGELPIDQKMLDAVEAQPKLANVIKSFDPAGRVGGIGRLERTIPKGPVVKTFDVRLVQCSVKHKSFNYPIQNVGGLVQVRDNTYTFSKLTGNNSSGKVDCDGTWDPERGLKLRFLCRSIPLDDQLRFALKPDIREIWNGFRPRGTLDNMTVDLRLPVGGEVDVAIDAHMAHSDQATDSDYISIRPIWFPYEISRLSGHVHIGGGQIRLDNFKGQHQRTSVFCQGEGRYSDEAWAVKLKDLLVTSLKVDEDLLAAVPTTIAPPIRQLNFVGLLNVNGEITVAGSKQTTTGGLRTATLRPAAFARSETASDNQAAAAFTTTAAADSEPGTSLDWDLKFDMNQAQMMLGLPVNNVFGMVQLIGHYDGQVAECRGNLDIDSMTIYDNQITQVKGPIWLDNQRSAAGSFARPAGTNDPRNLSPVAAATQPDSITGLLHGGVIKFDAEMDSDSKGAFQVQTTLADGCLQTACREFGAQLDNVEGRSFAQLKMRGDASGTHSHKGEGTIQLRDAQIYELPVFLSLLKILNVRQLTRTAFDSSNIDFSINGEDLIFHRMEFIGDAISLIGNGRMNLDQDIDLNFYSVMGRGRINIPLISELYRASSQKVLWINVVGTLENPQTHRNVLPQLNDSLKRLLQPREAAGGGSPAQRGQFGGQAVVPGLANANEDALLR